MGYNTELSRWVDENVEVRNMIIKIIDDHYMDMINEINLLRISVIHEDVFCIALLSEYQILLNTTDETPKLISKLSFNDSARISTISNRIKSNCITKLRETIVSLNTHQHIKDSFKECVFKEVYRAFMLDSTRANHHCAVYDNCFILTSVYNS